MHGVRVSNIEPRTYGLGRFLLFQSVRQVVSYLATLLIAVCIFIVLPHFIIGTAPSIAVFFVIVAGTVPSLYLSMPYRFVISTTTNRPLPMWINATLDENLIDIKYRRLCSDGNTITYTSKLPKLLKWNESNVYIRWSSELIVVEGCRISIKRLRTAINTKVNNAC